MADKAREGSAAGVRALAGPQAATGGGKAITAADPARDGGPGTAAALGFASVQMAAAAAEPPPSFPMTPAGFMALQRLVGNRAVASAMERSARGVPVLQRVPVAYGGTGETLYNEEDASGKAKANQYGGSGTFQLTRDGDAGVGIEVRIRFLKQNRNTMPPRKGHPKDPAVGDLTGKQTVLPAGDQAWATQTAADAVTKWNGKLVLVGKDVPRPDAEVTKRLPVTFKATAVFGLTDPADTEVIVHPPGVIGGSTGNPIDAGNYYMKKDDSVYPESDAMIYAHEYGHLMGINDEYSQSNEQMNLLIHRAAPGTAASSMAALDKKTLELMALALLTRPLYGRLIAGLSAVKNAIAGQKKAVKKKMAEAAKAAAKSPEIGQLLTDRLSAMATERVKKQVPRAVAIQTTSNFAGTKIATSGVDRILAPGGVTKLIGDAYWDALVKPQGENINIPGLGEVKIDVASSIFSAGGRKGRVKTDMQKAAEGEAESSVGKPGLPKIQPAGSLIGQLTAVPGTWNAAGGAVETGINAGTFAAKMKATLEAATAAAVAPPPGGAAAKPSLKSSQRLYEKAWVLMYNAANAAVQQLTSELVTSTMNPVLQASATALQTAIADEVKKVMTMTPTELAANPSRDENMAAIVGDMKSRLDSAKTALKGTGMDPLGTGGTSPAQDVTYSYQGMMGSGKTTAMRPDQFQQIVDTFNDKLKYKTEQKFAAEVK